LWGREGPTGAPQKKSAWGPSPPSAPRPHALNPVPPTRPGGPLFRGSFPGPPSVPTTRPRPLTPPWPAGPPLPPPPPVHPFFPWPPAVVFFFPPCFPLPPPPRLEKLSPPRTPFTPPSPPKPRNKTLPPPRRLPQGPAPPLCPTKNDGPPPPCVLWFFLLAQNVDVVFFFCFPTPPFWSAPALFVPSCPARAVCFLSAPGP